jgi:hypothetical protein
MDPAEEHDWLVLVPRGHRYARFISDLAAYDPSTHDGSAESVVYAVMAWLSTRKDAIRPVNPPKVVANLPVFSAAKRELDLSWGGYPPWSEIVLAAIKIARTLD